MQRYLERGNTRRLLYGPLLIIGGIFVASMVLLLFFSDWDAISNQDWQSIPGVGFVFGSGIAVVGAVIFYVSRFVFLLTLSHLH